jgi:hypothetical protein
MIDITTFELFFCGARTLIGKRQQLTNGSPGRISPVYQLERQPAQHGLATVVYPVGWFPVTELPLPDDAMAFPISKLGPEEQRQLARSCEKAEEMLQQMRAAGSGIALTSQMPRVK